MTVRILVGDVRDRLKNLPDESVHCVVTSPPYWGLRDYGTAEWEGGDGNCDHRHQQGGEGTSSAKQNTSTGTQSIQYRELCGKCGAIRVDRQLGLEPTPEEHVEAMTVIFRDVRRVLRSDGVCWVNYGDSYVAGNPGKCSGDSMAKSGLTSRGRGKKAAAGKARDALCDRPTRDFGRLQSKQLVGMPWRIAFALQADGWYLRSDVIWAKPNPMPESVTDRPTKAHEYVFLLTKSARYFYDADAVREESVIGEGAVRNITPRLKGSDASRSDGDRYGIVNNGTRNLRTVWQIPTHAFPGAHFATFPPKLVERCIKAGCPQDGTVFDPFGGAGTTGLVADRLQRDAILIELNEEYAKMARKRIYDDCPMFCEVATE